MYNILICDDEQDIVNALKIYLSGGDYCLFEASNGREALEVVEKNDIHLILMDIMMPQLDGIAATAKLREKSNVPIILLTAKSESSDKVLGLNIGADDYITKPFDPVEVLARVRSQLRRYTQLGAKKEEEKPNVYTVGPIVLDEVVWKEDSLGAETSVSVHIRHLRQKLEINPSEPRYLKVVWGLGYKMEDKK